MHGAVSPASSHNPLEISTSSKPGMYSSRIIQNYLNHKLFCTMGACDFGKQINQSLTI